MEKKREGELVLRKTQWGGEQPNKPKATGKKREKGGRATPTPSTLLRKKQKEDGTELAGRRNSRSLNGRSP